MPNYNTTLQTNNSSLEEIITQLNNMPDAGGASPVLQDKTITPTTSKQTVTADPGYDGLDAVTVNAMPTAPQVKPTITVNSSGLITATATQMSGYVSAGTKSATKQLAFQAAKTITPSTMDQIAVSSGYYTGGNITVKGDSNLVASNIVSGKSIFGVVGTATAGGGGSVDTSIEDSLITKTVTTYTNDRVTSVGDYMFYRCFSLTSVSFPAATSIGSYTFWDCRNLTSIDFPKASWIGSYAFAGCSRLTSVSFPVATLIMNYAFSACFSLTSVNFPSATAIYGYAFYNCSSLTSVSFPSATNIGSWAFYRCSSLTSVSFPAATNISSSAFQGCSSLEIIYLIGSKVCTLSNSNAFAYTSIGSTKGSIFVPASLVATYKTATNWTYFSKRIFAYDDSGDSGESEGGTITFYVDMVKFTTTSGTTWDDFATSDDSLGFESTPMYVYYNDIPIYDDTATLVGPKDIIIDSAFYNTGSGQ